MAILLRTIEDPAGRIRIALCAAETDEMPGDVYLHDGDHYALAAKFADDWKTGVEYPEEWAAMAAQKLRDAEEQLVKWIAAENLAALPE